MLIVDNTIFRIIIVDHENKRIAKNVTEWCVNYNCLIYAEDDDNTNFFIPLNNIKCFSITKIESE